MRNRIIGISACFIILIVAVSASYYLSIQPDRYHQHRSAEEKQECAHDEDVFCTHLPLIKIDTAGLEIPGAPIVDEQDGHLLGYKTSEDGNTFITADISIIDNERANNHVDDIPAVASYVEIGVRGNSSRSFDKKGYKLRLINERGENDPRSVIGMPEHHEWVLHGPFLDKTLFRNYMWYNISGDIMDYAPNVRFCELFINDEYQGVYVMLENITAGTNGARLDVSVSKKLSTFNGYILRLDRGSENELSNISTFTQKTYRTDQMIDIVYPGSGNLTEKLADDIRQDFSDFEKALYSYDYDNEKYGYENYIDIDSFIDFFIINELTCNYDAGWLSTYIYKEIDGKYRMCVWDFNSACDYYMRTMADPQHFELQDTLWYFMLFKDEDFTERVIKRYRLLRTTYLSDEYIDKYITDTVDYLGDAISRNYDKWGYSFNADHDMLIPSERNPRTYDEAIAQLRGFLDVRGKWMDSNIDTLRQYSAESKVKKFNETAN